MNLLFKTSSLKATLWQSELQRLVPDLVIRKWPDFGDPGEIDLALVWRPPHGLLKTLPKLKLIMSLGAGVDHLFEDPELPRVPVMRLVDPRMIGEMTEYVTLAVLRLHRLDLTYLEQQRERRWAEHIQPVAAERRVGVLGLGQYGSDAAFRLKSLGFDVAGWSRSPKNLPGIACYAGESGLAAMLARTEILVCLLPLTPETEGILGAGLFAALPRGAMIVNVGRGRHLVEVDLLAALESGQLGGAVLDVFREEPLPEAHPFWRHPHILVTPHVAAATNPLTCAPLIAEAIGCIRHGRPVANLVDPERQY
jgi:glyoxylate/hydroxypyruvate reductase A